MCVKPYKVVLCEAPDSVSAEFGTLLPAVMYAQQDSEFGVLTPDGELYVGYASLNELERQGYIQTAGHYGQELSLADFRWSDGKWMIGGMAAPAWLIAHQMA